MNIRSITTRIQKIDKQNHKNDKNKLVGALLKKKRISMNKTIGEFSEGICSISYQSKVESNQIVPNGEYLSLLMERANMKMEEITAIENSDELLNKSIFLFFEGKSQEYSTLIDEYKDIKENPCIDTIKLGYFCLTGNLKSAEETLGHLIPFASSLDRNTLVTISYYAGYYYLYTRDYETANNILLSLFSIKVNNDLWLPFLEFKYLLHISENKFYFIHEDLNELIEECIKTNKTSNIIKYKLLFANSLIDIKEYRCALDILIPLEDSFYPYENDTLNYLLACCYYELDNTMGAKEYLDEITPFSKYFRYVLDMKYALSEDREDFLSFVKTISNENDKKDFYLLYFIADKSQGLNLELLNTDSFKDEYQSSDISGKLRLLRMEYQILCKASRYKEAVSIYNKMEKLKITLF